MRNEMPIYAGREGILGGVRARHSVRTAGLEAIGRAAPIAESGTLWLFAVLDVRGGILPQGW
jgi:hypothetical protein